MAVNAFFVEDSSLPREGGLVNDIAFTFWVDYGLGRLSGPSLEIMP